MIYKGRGASRKPAAGLRNSDAERNLRCRGRVRPYAAIQSGNAGQGARAAAHFGGAAGVIGCSRRDRLQDCRGPASKVPIGPRMTGTCI